MVYESKKTPRGNVGFSYESQEEADAQASQMDANGCSDCYNCYNCYDCYNCRNCFDCRNCYDCSGCYNCCNCSDCSDCRNCHNCSGCYNCCNCSDCRNCSDCSDCSGVLHWSRSGSTASSLLALNGLTWPVATDGKSIQIGCQHHSVEAWRGFSDAEISRMEERALVFWQAHKDQILLLAEMRRSMNV